VCFRRDTLMAVLACAGLCHAQPSSPVAPSGETEVAVAVKSPDTFARYVESHSGIDWKIVRKALGLEESKNWLAPCGSNFPAAEAPCSAELAAVLNPPQTIVIIRGGDFAATVEYLRFLNGPKGGWKIGGENNAFQRTSPSHHKVVRLGNKPFFMISSDHSQNGMATQQVLEDWFDLTQPDFKAVLSITVDGAEGRFGLGVGRSIHARPSLGQSAGSERVTLILNVQFQGVGLRQDASYVGVYERHTDEKKFILRSAYSGLDRSTPMATTDFEELADPFSGISNEKLLAYALPGLQKIAGGSDSDAKNWLRSVLDNAGDTREKRLLLGALTKR
jgi:hypothetical protein